MSAHRARAGLGFAGNDRGWACYVVRWRAREVGRARRRRGGRMLRIAWGAKVPASTRTEWLRMWRAGEVTQEFAAEARSWSGNRAEPPVGDWRDQVPKKWGQGKVGERLAKMGKAPAKLEAFAGDDR